MCEPLGDIASGGTAACNGTASNRVTIDCSLSFIALAADLTHLVCAMPVEVHDPLPWRPGGGRHTTPTNTTSCCMVAPRRCRFPPVCCGGDLPVGCRHLWQPARLRASIRQTDRHGSGLTGQASGYGVGRPGPPASAGCAPGRPGRKARTRCAHSCGAVAAVHRHENE